MSFQALDVKQIEENSRIIEELKASIAALKEATEDYLVAELATEEEKTINRTKFTQFFAQNLNRIRGVDIITNLSIGKVLLTKYSKEPKARRWEINNVSNDSKSE